MGHRVRFPDHIEPLVQFVEETTPDRIVAETHDKLVAGTPVKDMLLASALAVVRSSDLPPGHHGGPLHPLAGLHAVRHITRPTNPAMMIDVDNLIKKHELLERDLRVKTGDDETEAITRLADRIGRCHDFAEIPEMLAQALGDGLSLEGTGEGLSVGGSTVFLRSLTGNPMDVHINTGANTRRYLLGQPELSRRIKLQALLVWHTGPEVRMAQRMLAPDVQPEPQRVAALPSRT